MLDIAAYIADEPKNGSNDIVSEVEQLFVWLVLGQSSFLGVRMGFGMSSDVLGVVIARLSAY